MISIVDCRDGGREVGGGGGGGRDCIVGEVGLAKGIGGMRLALFSGKGVEESWDISSDAKYEFLLEGG